MKTGTTTPLASESAYLVAIAVSPDHNWLAYGLDPVNDVRSAGKIYFQNQYGVMMADGSQRQEIARRPGWHALSHWLDNEHVVLSESAGLEIRPWTLVVFNPFTGQEEKFPPDFPDIYDADILFPVPEWENYIGVTSYDGTLTRAVYARIQGGDTTGYVLWDVINGRELAFLPSPYLNQTPKWSPDNSQLVVAAYLAPRDAPLGKPELFSINRDGVITQLTNLSTYPKLLDIASYSWSPDGRYVAFWMDTLEPYNERLAILDLATHQVTDYCIQGNYGGRSSRMFEFLGSRLTTVIPPPVWAPNSQQLVIENRYAQDASRIVLLDLSQGTAVQIAENMMPVGWMAVH